MSRDAKLRRTMSVLWALLYGAALLAVSRGADPGDLWVWPYRAVVLAATVYTVGSKI